MIDTNGGISKSHEAPDVIFSVDGATIIGIGDGNVGIGKSHQTTDHDHRRPIDIRGSRYLARIKRRDDGRFKPIKSNEAADIRRPSDVTGIIGIGDGGCGIFKSYQATDPRGSSYVTGIIGIGDGESVLKFIKNPAYQSADPLVSGNVPGIMGISDGGGTYRDRMYLPHDAATSSILPVMVKPFENMTSKALTES
jgi:hypothetical protein